MSSSEVPGAPYLLYTSKDMAVTSVSDDSTPMDPVTFMLPDSPEAASPRIIPFPWWRSNSVESASQPEAKPLAKKLVLTHRPLIVTLRIFGRFPFAPSVDQDGNMSYQCYWKSLRGLYFVLTSIVLLFVLVDVCVGFIFLIKSQFGKSGSQCESECQSCCEWMLFMDNVVIFLVFFSCLINASVETFVCVLSGKKFAAYLTSWLLAVEEMKMDIFEGLKRVVWREMAVFHAFVLVVVVLFVMDVPQIRQGAEVVAALTLIPFVCDPINLSSFLSLTFLAAFFVMQSYHAYKGGIMMYMFYCRLLRRAFREWNSRLTSALQNEKPSQHEHRTSFDELYEDHIRLIQLVHETDRVFAPTLLVFYGSQVLALCLEFYFAVNLVVSETEILLVGVVVIFQTALTFFLVSLSASAVYEQTLKGFEIIRKHSFPNDYRRVPKTFIDALTTSFVGHPIMLTGGHFFGISREFILKALGVALTYFIIILQFSPDVSEYKNDCLYKNCPCAHHNVTSRS